MPFSTKLASYLKRGQFPLKGSMDIPLWQELLLAMETDPIKATVEAKALLEGKNFWIFADTITVNDVGFKVGGGDLAAMSDVGMTPGRLNALAACGSKAQREVIEAEQYLPAAIVLSLSAQDAAGTWHTIVPNHRIENFVPQTVPVI